MTGRIGAPTPAGLARAVAHLRAGELVAFPTETVYGLGGDAANPDAVRRIFAAKGRPADHPLIVHIGSAAGLSQWASGVPGYAVALADAFWPGPLTLVLARSDLVGDSVTGGQDTVAIRVPDHPSTLRVLRRLATGVAAPSANRFGRVSPTTAQHVAEELGDLLDPSRDLILDGGPTRVGLESTIVDCTGDLPRLLRPGAISAADITAATGLPVSSGPGRVRAPGTLAAHYAPSARVRVSADGGPDQAPHRDPVLGLIAPAELATPVGVVRLLAPRSVEAYGAGLYAALREADALGLREVRVVLPDGPGLAAAIRDRVRRAEAGSGGAG
jgi:L-threonylcarbamoyladenylate synthase